ncbi:MAG: hypothetical protein ACLTK0_06380 [Anaerovoracaceae bacterium]
MKDIIFMKRQVRYGYEKGIDDRRPWSRLFFEIDVPACGTDMAAYDVDCRTLFYIGRGLIVIASGSVSRNCNIFFSPFSSLRFTFLSSGLS